MKSALILCAALIGTVPLPVHAQSIDIGAPPGRLVDVGGRTLHALCSGAGAPTVVLEAGASAFAIDWSLVQPGIARSNRVCSYDRAGYGWSEPGGPETADRVVADLHAMLQAAGEKPPFVLVGASRGGLFVRLYAARYPDDVSGMVLVDPSHEDRLFTMFNGQGVTIASLSAEQLRSTMRPGPVRIPARSPQTGAPFDRLPPDLYARRIALDRRLIAATPSSISYEANAEGAEAERAALARLHEISVTQDRPLGDRPLVVLTRGVDSSQEQKDVHASLGRLTTNFRHSVVAGAGHEIHLFQPIAVIQAIQDAIAAAKGKTRLPAR